MNCKRGFIELFKKAMCFVGTVGFALAASINGSYTLCMSFSKNNLCLSSGQSAYLKPCYTGPGRIQWQTNNPSCVRVNDCGFIDAVSPGEASITAKNCSTGEKISCTVNVKQRDPVKISYALPNNASVNSEISLIASTYKDVQSVRFEICKDGGKYTVDSNNKISENDTYIWFAEFKGSSQGRYEVKAFSQRNGNWDTCDNGTFDIFVSNVSDFNDSSADYKRASDRCIDFIASCEGFSSKVYRDPVNIPSIGYGNLIQPYQAFYDNLTQREALGYLLKTVNEFPCASVNRFMNRNKIMFSQCQLDALVSFSYNLGSWWTNGNNEIANLILDSGSGELSEIGVVNSSNGINIREAPDTSGRILKSISNNSRVRIYRGERLNGNWLKVKTCDGIIGYCCGDFIQVLKTPDGYKNLDLIDEKKFTDIISSYHHANKKCFRGLLMRRFQELDMFFYGQYNRYTCKYQNKNNYSIPLCIKSI